MFKEFFVVRDNEVDIQGVVNNANYFVYMAHARHMFLHNIGIDFAKMAQENQMLFLINANIDFRKPLKPNDKFYVSCEVLPTDKIRIVFKQEVRLVDSDALMATGINTAACIDGNTKRPYIPDLFKQFMKDSLKENNTNNEI